MRVLVRLFRRGPTRRCRLGHVFEVLGLGARPTGVLYISILRSVTVSSCVGRAGQLRFQLGASKRAFRTVFGQGTGNGGAMAPISKKRPVLITRHGSLRTVGNSEMDIALLTHHERRIHRTRIIRVLRQDRGAFMKELRIDGSCTFLLARSHALTGSVFVPHGRLGKNGANSGTVIGVAR